MAKSTRCIKLRHLPQKAKGNVKKPSNAVKDKVVRAAEKTVCVIDFSNHIDTNLCHIHRNKVFTQTLAKMSFNNDNYEKQKDGVVHRFYDIIAQHPIIAPLSEMVKDQFRGKTSLWRLELLCRGVKSPEKKNILSQVVLVFSTQLKRSAMRQLILRWKHFLQEQADACYQPNVTDLQFKLLFSYWKKRIFCMKKSVISEKMGLFRPFGRRFLIIVWHLGLILERNHGRLRLTKMRRKKCTVGGLRPCDVYRDCLLLLVHFTLKVFQLRRQKEVCISLFVYILFLYYY